MWNKITVIQITSERCRREMILKRGEVLFIQDEESDIYLLKRGLLKAVRLQSDGSSFLFNILVPGEQFPHHSLLTPNPTFGTVSAILESEVEVTSKHDWYDQLEREPMRYKEVAVRLEATVKRVQRRTQLLLAPPKERIALFREWLGLVETDMRIEALLTQEEIGQFLGLARETVNRLLRYEVNCSK